MRKIFVLAITLWLFLPTAADQEDYLRFNLAVQYLTESSKSQPTADSLLAAAKSALPEQGEPSIKGALEAAQDGGRLQKQILAAMLKSLNDPWARIYTPEEVAQVRARLNGERDAALGITVVKVKAPASYRVVGVAPGGPAEGKLKSGDAILSANGVSASSDSFKSEISGEEGKVVNLEVANEAGEARQVAVTLSTFDSKTAYVEDLERGVIRITSFGPDTHKELREAMAALEGRPAIIDLRFNGGGYVTTAVESADLFLDPGDKVVTTVSPNETKVHEADEAPSFSQPVCILVNDRTASAAEIFTAALKSHVNAFVVGDKTYGKGSVQRLVSLPGNWGLKYTTSLYQTPEGVYIDKVGIQPDRTIDMEPALTASTSDTQLAAALAWAKDQTSVAARP